MQRLRVAVRVPKRAALMTGGIHCGAGAVEVPEGAEIPEAIKNLLDGYLVDEGGKANNHLTVTAFTWEAVLEAAAKSLEAIPREDIRRGFPGVLLIPALLCTPGGAQGGSFLPPTGPSRIGGSTTLFHTCGFAEIGSTPYPELSRCNARDLPARGQA